MFEHFNMPMRISGNVNIKKISVMTKQENDTYSENHTYSKRDVEMIYAGIWQGSVFGFSSTEV